MFWKPGTAAPGLDNQFDRNLSDEKTFIFNKYKNLALSQQRARLPIAKNSKIK
jgi:hypothetical protein